MSDKTLPERLRYLLRGKRHHFTTAGGVQLFAVVGTAEQMQDLELAAGALEKPPYVSPALRAMLDAPDSALLTHEQVRQMVMTVKFEQRDELEINRVLNDLCRRLGVEL